MIDSLCISGTACEGSAGSLWLAIRDAKGATVARVELTGVDGSFNTEFKFDAPVDASTLREATIIGNDDSATITWFSVTGNSDCFSYTYYDHGSDGAVIGKDGCPRFVLF
jgi:hypothetical protein